LIISHEFSRIIRVRCEASLVKLSAMLLRGSGKRKLDFGILKYKKSSWTKLDLFRKLFNPLRGWELEQSSSPSCTRGYYCSTPAGVLGVFSYDRISKIADNKTNLYE